MNLYQANERIAHFFDGRQLTFGLQRFGESQEEWIVRCNEIPAISTSGFGFDERVIAEQIKDAIVTSAGVDGEFTDDVLKQLNFTNQFAMAI